MTETAPPDTEVHDNEAQHRYEISRNGEVLGIAVYLRRGDTVVMVHTEVEPGHDGEGLGSTLAQGALDDVRRRDLHVVPICPFIAGYIRRHPEYQDLVSEYQPQVLRDF
jgi:uncharacterized protein